MLLLSLILLAVSLLLFGIGGAICKGNTALIHDYHLQKVKKEDLPAYGRAVAKGLFCFAAALLIGALLPLFGETGWTLPAILWITGVGFAVSLFILIWVQKKYAG